MATKSREAKVNSSQMQMFSPDLGSAALGPVIELDTKAAKPKSEREPELSEGERRIKSLEALMKAGELRKRSDGLGVALKARNEYPNVRTSKGWDLANERADIDQDLSESRIAARRHFAFSMGAQEIPESERVPGGPVFRWDDSEQEDKFVMAFARLSTEFGEVNPDGVENCEREIARLQAD